MITLENKMHKQMIRKTCEVMASLAIQRMGNDELLENYFDNTPGSNLFEDLALQLDILGVHEPHIEWFWEILNEDEFPAWIETCVLNLGPEA